ncbi:hypothetical protein BRADI_3g35422v3, partial [Brachypodium distachyon]
PAIHGQPKASTVPELPDDLVTEVLLRLPARSLARFRCVCPCWDAEITSGSFKERHLLRASKAARLAFVPRAPRSCSTPLPFWLRCSDCSRVIGTKPCRGVFLAENCEGAYSVCNPSTGGVVRLPLLRGRHPRFNSAGIGFDSQTGDYKVVNLMVDPRRGSQCHVLTVGAAGGIGIWRPPAASAAAAGHQISVIKDDDAMAGIFVDRDVDPVIADGRLHWICRTSFSVYNEPHVILSFSLADECFRQLPQPLFSASDVDVPIVCRDISRGRIKLLGRTTPGSVQEFVVMPAGRALVELDGGLCIVRDVRRRNDVGNRLLEIWRLQDCEAGTWSMDYSISLTEEVAKQQQLTRPWLVVLPVCYLGSEQDTQAASRKLLLVTTAHEAYVHDPATNSLETVAVDGFVPADQGTSPFPLSDFVRHLLYQESLVQFVGMEHGRGSVIDELRMVPLSLT